MEFLERYYTNNYKSFNEWIELIKKGEHVYPRFRIPYRDWLDRYLNDIAYINEEEVKTLLRLLLQPFTRKIDIEDYKLFHKIPRYFDSLGNKTKKEFLKIHNHNLKCEKYKRIENGQEAWEGLTWILQFLPYNPLKAIKALILYLEAEAGSLPDDRIIGIEQCIDIIEAKYINNTIGLEKYILNLNPQEFEWLIEILYQDMGYQTKLTPSTRDGGKDIIAYISREDGDEKVYVECKLYKTTELTKDSVRAFGYTINKDNINRGALFCTGYVNEYIKNMDERIQIWTLEEIIMLLNANVGSDWHRRLNLLLENQRRKYSK